MTVLLIEPPVVGTAGGLVYFDENQRPTSDNANLFYDDANDRAVFGPRGTGTTAGRIYSVDTGAAATRGIVEYQVSADALGAQFIGRKSRGTPSAPAIITSGDTLNQIVGEGYDGVAFLQMGSIQIVSAGTIAATRVPTEIVFSTATDAALSVLTEAARFTRAQELLIGTTATLDSGVRLQVQGADSEIVALFKANATPGGQIIRVEGGNDTSALYQQFVTSGATGGGFIGVEGSVAGSLMTGTLAYATVLAASSATTALQLGTPGNIAVTIDSSQNVGIGLTPTIGTKVEVAAANASGAIGLTVRGSAHASPGSVAQFSDSAGTGQVFFSPLDPTNRYGMRIAAMSGAATLNVGARIDTATTAALWLGGDVAGTTVAGGIVWGSSRDVNLYRSAADVLKTDDNFLGASVSVFSGANIMGGLVADGNVSGGTAGVVLQGTAGRGVGAIPISAGVVAWTIKGLASQIGNLLDLKDSADVVYLSGIVRTDAGAERVGLEIRTHASQSTRSIFQIIDSDNVETKFAIFAPTATDDSCSIRVGTSVGLKIGTAPTQKLAAFDATPVVQPALTADLLDSLQALGWIASGAGDTPLNLSGGALTAGTGTFSGSNVAIGINPSGTGTLRLPNTGNVYFRDAANTLDRAALEFTAGDVLIVGSGSAPTQVSALTTLELLTGGTARVTVTDTTLTIAGALDHDGSTVGFYTVAPVARSTGWAITNDTTERTFDANATSIDELADVVATLIRDVAATGLVGAVA